MKKLLITLFILPLIFSSCEEEDNTPSVSPPPTNPIHGTWILDTGIYEFSSGYINSMNIEVPIDDTISYLPSSGVTSEWIFYSNGTITENHYHSTILDQTDDMNYTISGDTIITIDNSHIWTITKLTNDTLICNNHTNNPQTWTDNGIDMFEYHKFDFTFFK
jgi:hypothetical protein